MLRFAVMRVNSSLRDWGRPVSVNYQALRDGERPVSVNYRALRGRSPNMVISLISLRRFIIGN